MVIREMTLEECRQALAEADVMRLACESDGQPYIVPTYLAYDGDSLYGFSTVGRKIDCMRANPLVCLEIDEVESQDRWMSLVVFGKYEELPDTPAYEGVRRHVQELLEKRAMWWEPGYAAGAHGDRARPLTPVFYRIHIARMTGLRADPGEVQPVSPTKARSRLSGVLDRILGR